ncbi:MAG: glycosyltransferase [Oscillospiraceae bacterium]|nr:glycosyltransferase [Oscillospiraceae bacterium]
MKILAVVVTYNRKKLLEECLQALLTQTYDSFDILIIDNASTDGTKKMIERFESNRIIYFNNGVNWGAATGFTYGINRAIVDGYDYCWTMDDDTVPNITAIESDIKKVSWLNGKFSFMASMVEWTNGEHCIFNTPYLVSDIFHYNKAMEQSLLPANSCSYTSCLFNLSVVKEAGLPIKEYQIYGDDMEFTSRLSNFEPGYLNLESVVVHKMSSLGNANIWDCDKNRIERWNYAYRNHHCTARRGNNLYYGCKKNLVYAIKSLARIILRSKSHRIKRLSAVLRGYYSGFFFNPPIIKEYKERFFLPTAEEKSDVLNKSSLDGNRT